MAAQAILDALLADMLELLECDDDDDSDNEGSPSSPSSSEDDTAAAGSFKLGHADVEAYLSRQGFTNTLEAYSNDRSKNSEQEQQPDSSSTTITLASITRKAKAWDTARVKIQKLIDTCTQLAQQQGSPAPISHIPTPTVLLKDIEEGELDRQDAATQTDDIVKPKADVGISTYIDRSSYRRDIATHTLDDGVVQAPKISIPLRRSVSRTSPPTSSTSASVDRGTSPVPSAVPPPPVQQEQPRVNGQRQDTMTRSAKASILQSRLAAALDSKHLCFSITELRALAASPPITHVVPVPRAQPPIPPAAAHVVESVSIPNGHSPSASINGTAHKKQPIQLGQVYQPSSGSSPAGASARAPIQQSNATITASKDTYQTQINSASASPVPGSIANGHPASSATASPGPPATATAPRPYPAPVDPRRARQQQQQRRQHSLHDLNTQASIPSTSTSQEPAFQSPSQTGSAAQPQEASTSSSAAASGPISAGGPAEQAEGAAEGEAARQAQSQSQDPKDPPPSIMDLVPEYLKNRPPKGRQSSIDLKKSSVPTASSSTRATSLNRAGTDISANDVETSSLASSDAEGESDDDMEIEEQESEGQEGAGKLAQTNADQVAANAAVDSFLDLIAGDTGPPNDGDEEAAGLEEDHLPSSQELEHLFDESIPEPAPNTTSRNHVAQASTSPIPPSSANTNAAASSSSSITSTYQAKDRILSMFAKKPTAVPPRPLPSLHSNLRLSTSKPIAVASRTTVPIDKERARLLHEETTLRMAKQRETMARNAEAANKRLMAEKQKLAELIRAKDASSSSNVQQVVKTAPATALEEEETLEDTELQATDNLHMDEPPSSSASLAALAPEPQTQNQLQAQAHAQIQAESSDAAAKAISREAELKRRLKRQRLPSDSESSDVPAKKAAVSKANSPVPAPPPLSISTTVHLEQSQDELVPQPGQAASPAQLVASPIRLENQESNSDQALNPISELLPSAVLPHPTQQQQEVPHDTLLNDPPVASTSKLPPPAKATAKAKAKSKQPRKLIPIVEIPYKKIVIPPPRMVKKKKKTITKSATPAEKPDMGTAEAQASAKEASSSPELAPPLSSLAMQTSDGVSTPSKPARPSNKAAAAGSSSKTAIAVIDISDDSEDEDANVPLVGLTDKGKQPAKETPSKPVTTSRTVESPSPGDTTAPAKTAAPPSPSQSQATSSSIPPAILSRAEAQQQLAEQRHPYITIYKLDLAEFAAKGIKVDETMLQEHFGSHSPLAVLQDNTAWYATFSDATGAAQCAAAADNRLLSGLEIPLQVDEPPAAPKNEPAHSRPAAPSAASASASHAPAEPPSSVGENPSGEASSSVSADLSTAVPVTTTIVDDVSMSKEPGPPLPITAEHHSLSKSASSRLEKRIDDLLSESRPASNSSDTRKKGHTHETTRIMSSQSPEPDELVGDVEMEDASEQLLSKAPLADVPPTAMQSASIEQSRDTVLMPVDVQRSRAAAELSTSEQALLAKAPSPAPSTSTEEPPSILRVGQTTVSTHYKPLGSLVSRGITPPVRVSASDLMSPTRASPGFSSLPSAVPPSANRTPAQTPTNSRTARNLTYQSPVSATGTVRSEDSVEIIMDTPRSFLPDRPLEEPVSKCKFSTGCINMLCKFAHPSAFAPRHSNLPTTARKCPDEALCREPDCHLSHPSPATHRNEICPNQDNCPLGAKCAFRHVDQGRSALIRRPYQSHNQSAVFTNPAQQSTSSNQTNHTTPYSHLLPPRQAAPVYSNHNQPVQSSNGQSIPATQVNAQHTAQQTSSGGGVFGYLSSSAWNLLASRRNA